jgi:hypothetical protein
MSEAADVLGVLRVRFTRLDERIERRLDLADEMTAPGPLTRSLRRNSPSAGAVIWRSR